MSFVAFLILHPFCCVRVANAYPGFCMSFGSWNFCRPPRVRFASLSCSRLSNFWLSSVAAGRAYRGSSECTSCSGGSGHCAHPAFSFARSTGCARCELHSRTSCLLILRHGSHRYVMCSLQIPPLIATSGNLSACRSAFAIRCRRFSDHHSNCAILYVSDWPSVRCNDDRGKPYIGVMAFRVRLVTLDRFAFVKIFMSVGDLCARIVLCQSILWVENG